MPDLVRKLIFRIVLAGPTVKALPEGRVIQLIWLRLLAMAGKTNDNGYVYIKGIPLTRWA